MRSPSGFCETETRERSVFLRNWRRYAGAVYAGTGEAFIKLSRSITSTIDTAAVYWDEHEKEQTMMLTLAHLGGRAGGFLFGPLLFRCSLGL